VVLAVDNASFRRPTGIYFGKDLVDDLVAFRIDRASFIGPDSQDAARFQYATCLVKKMLDIEPVKCLRDGNQVDRVRIDARRLGDRNPKFYLSMRIGRGDLLVAGVRRHDLLEERGKGPCGLAVASGAVPRKRMLVTECCQVGEQRFRIAGPMRSIAASVAGKMILEADVGRCRY